jgi:hypothetical protein
MKEGDLCYIPQAVQLFNEREHPCVITTQKPTAAIYLGEKADHHALLWFRGRQMVAQKRHVYPMEEKC